MYFRHPLVPRNGCQARVGIVARISGCGGQKEVSLDDQVDHGKEVTSEVYEGEADYIVISTIGKGERLDRPELVEIEKLLRSGTLDLLICEDAGRLIRGADAVRLFGIAVDHGTRCIAPNDGVDTIDPNWEEDLLAACRDHVGHNTHSSKRIKHKLMNRFRKSGGALPGLIAGYFKPDGAKSYFDIQKVESATAIIQEGARQLLSHGNCSAVATYFNKVQFPVGPSCRRKEWDGKMVRRFYKNPTLIGRPERGNMVTVKHHETGRRKPTKNPLGPIAIDCPHLAHLAPDFFAEVNDHLSKKNSRHKRAEKKEDDCRLGVPRKRTIYPGQEGTCYYCGSHFVWGGNGITNHLMCARSRDWKCWNSVGFKGARLVERVMEAVMGQLAALEGFDQQFREIIRTADLENSTGSELEALAHEERNLARDETNFLAAIEKYGPNDMFDRKFAEIEERRRELSRKRNRIEMTQQRPLILPESPAELLTMAKSTFCDLSAESSEFGDVLRQIVPKFYIYLVRSIDGGHLLPRAQVHLDFSGIAPDAKLVPGLASMLESTVTVDIFDPPQRERIRPVVNHLLSLGHGPTEICQLIDENPKLAAVQRSIKLQKQMDHLGVDSPYTILDAPPENYGRLRRHQNPKYRFTPLPNYDPPVLE